MGTEYLYDDGFPKEKGMRPYPEDGIILCPKNDNGSFFGVLDGVSFYTPATGPSLFNGLTQGQLAVRIVQSAFLLAKPGEPATETLIVANNILRGESEKHGLSLEQPELLPGTAFILMQIENENVSVVWGGDCGAVWLMKNGSIGGTENGVYDYELWVEETFADIKKRHNGNLNRAWEEWLPIRRDKIRQRQNKPGGWSTISGRPEFKNSWEEIKFPAKEVKLIIIFTDGFVQFKDTADPLVLAEKLIGLYFDGGLAAIMADTRLAQKKSLDRSHEATCPEATAMTIKF